MKKVLLFVSVFAVASLVSCKKERTCTCTNSSVRTDVVTKTGGATVTNGGVDKDNWDNSYVGSISTMEVVTEKAKIGAVANECTSTTETEVDTDTYEGSDYDTNSSTSKDYTINVTSTTVETTDCELK